MTETVGLEQAVLDKLRLLSPTKQRQVLAFITSLEGASLPNSPELPRALHEIARLPLEERHRLLAPSISATAEDFRTDPDLMEFEALDLDCWDLEE